MKTVGFISPFDPFHDKKAWSGTIYKLRESVQNAGYNVKWISINPSRITKYIITPILKYVVGKCWIYTDKKQKLSAKSIRIEELKNCDFLFFPGGAQLLEFLKLKDASLPPAIYCTDAVFRQMIDYYWFGIPKSIQNEGDILERKAIENWVRKGGDIAVDTVKRLNQDGFKSRLYVVGVNLKDIPDAYRNRDYVEYLGFLDKNNPDEYKQYIEVVRTCHCLLLPTHAECSSIVLCEAAAFGMPTFTSDTGGLSNYVINGKTGYRLSIHSNADDYAQAIERAIINNEMETLHKGALSYYQKRISWSAWSKHFSDVMVRHFGENE